MRTSTLNAIRDIRPNLPHVGEIVTASGCFDLLHVGHVRYLAAARTLGTFLVVLVSDDASVRQLKGPGRPIIPASQRAEVIRAIRVVDAVVVHSQEEVPGIIAALRVSVFAKGADSGPFLYEKEIARIVRRVERVCEGDPPSVHTTDIIRRCARLSHPNSS